MGDTWHTQNSQISKVIGENEKHDFYFTEKTEWTFWPTQYIDSSRAESSFLAPISHSFAVTVLPWQTLSKCLKKAFALN